MNRRQFLEGSIALSAAAALSLPDEAEAQTAVSVEHLKELLTPGTIVLDVRQQDERKGPDGKDFFLRCPKCRTIRAPFDHLTDGAFGFDDNDSASLEALKRNRKIVVVCREGVRSAAAATELKKRGFSGVYNLEGGMQLLPEELRNHSR